jgi:hypothetical protein
MLFYSRSQNRPTLQRALQDSRIQKRRLGGLRLTWSSLAHLHSKHESSLASFGHMFTVTIRYFARWIATLWARKAAMDTSRLWMSQHLWYLQWSAPLPTERPAERLRFKESWLCKRWRRIYKLLYTGSFENYTGNPVIYLANFLPSGIESLELAVLQSPRRAEKA